MFDDREGKTLANIGGFLDDFVESRREEVALLKVGELREEHVREKVSCVRKGVIRCDFHWDDFLPMHVLPHIGILFVFHFHLRNA